MSNEENLAKLEVLSGLAFKNLIEDADSKQYVLKRLQEYNEAEDGEKRILVEKPNADRLKKAIENIDSCDLYFWIGFLEMIGGPSKHTKKYRELQTKICEDNIGLCYHLAHSVMRNCTPMFEVDDLVSEGFMGMRYAVELFDGRHGGKLSTYAVTWIRQFMNRYILRFVSLVRVPEVTARERIKDGTLHLVISMDSSSTAKDFDTVSIIDSLVSKEPAVDRNTEASEESERLYKIFVKLSEREQQIIQMRYGLFGSPAMTLCSIGEQLDLSRERVRQIEAKALRRMKIMGGALEAV